MSYFQYKIFPHLRLIVEYYSGETQLADIDTYFDALIQDPDFSPKYNILRDSRDLQLKKTQNIVEQFVVMLKSKPNYLDKRKTVIVVNKPNETAILLMFISKTWKLFPHQIEVFSTTDSAMKYLDIEEDDRKTIENTLRELKSKAETSL